jgi:hypothetical protein
MVLKTGYRDYYCYLEVFVKPQLEGNCAFLVPALGYNTEKTGKI